MSEEERQAIEELIEFIEDNEVENISVFTAKKLKNIIDKQKKEIKKYKKFIEDKTKIGKDIQTFINKGYVEQEYISKDKIRAKIKDLKENDNGDDYSVTNVIMILKKLLEE